MYGIRGELRVSSLIMLQDFRYTTALEGRDSFLPFGVSFSAVFLFDFWSFFHLFSGGTFVRNSQFVVIGL